MSILNVPDNIETLLGTFVDVVRQQLPDTLIGIYLHGSLAMSSFNAKSSDIDLLVVVRDKLSLSEKQAFAQLLLQISVQAPRPLELSVVTLESLRNFRHPSLYELHFSDGNKADYANATIDFTVERNDSDLSAHFLITKVRGVCLYGEPIANVFPDVPDSAYLSSIVGDSDWSYKNIMQGLDNGECQVPIYGVLNFCRVLAFTQDHLVTSKREGALWGLRHLPQPYLPIIQEAFTEYMGSDTIQKVDAQLLKQFARYAYTHIHNFDR